MLRTFTCGSCGQEFTRNLGRTHPGRKYCSRACMGKAKQLAPSYRAGIAEELPCTKCKKVKPIAEFYQHARIARGYQYWCKECAHAERIERAKVPVDPHVRRRYALWSIYRLNVADYDAMYERQKGRCAICGDAKEPWEPGAGIEGRHRFLVVDHHHKTSFVRGLLCSRCNCGVGQFRENQAIMQAAIAYLASSNPAP